MWNINKDLISTAQTLLSQDPKVLTCLISPQPLKPPLTNLLYVPESDPES